jgi:hypothetical protein
MDGSRPRIAARPWPGRVGAALSLSALGFAVASLFGPHGPACPPPRGAASLDLTPLLLFGLAAFAVVVDVRSVRRGDRFWGRIGLVAVSVAAIVTVAGGTFGACG